MSSKYQLGKFSEIQQTKQCIHEWSTSARPVLRCHRPGTRSLHVASASLVDTNTSPAVCILVHRDCVPGATMITFTTYTEAKECKWLYIDRADSATRVQLLPPVRLTLCVYLKLVRLEVWIILVTYIRNVWNWGGTIGNITWIQTAGIKTETHYWPFAINVRNLVHVVHRTWLCFARLATSEYLKSFAARLKVEMEGTSSLGQCSSQYGTKCWS